MDVIANTQVGFGNLRLSIPASEILTINLFIINLLHWYYLSKAELMA